jgi:hypothetical protein
VPPLAVTVSVVVPPLQAILPDAVVAVIIEGSLIVTAVAGWVHPLASFTVTVYVPAPTVNVVPAWNVVPSILYVYGAVPLPPTAVNVVVPPLHKIVPALADAVGPLVFTIVAVAVKLHPLASFTSILCVPAGKFV